MNRKEKMVIWILKIAINIYKIIEKLLLFFFFTRTMKSLENLFPISDPNSFYRIFIVLFDEVKKKLNHKVTIIKSDNNNKKKYLKKKIRLFYLIRKANSE